MARGRPDVRGLFRLINLIKKIKPDIVHSHMVHANLLGRAARLCGPRFVLICTAHNVYECGRLVVNPKPKTWREMAYRVSDRLCELTTHVSRAGMKRYIDVRAARAGKIAYVPNGINLQAFRPSGENRTETRKELGLRDEFVWLSAARFEPVKDHLTLLDAFARTLKHCPDAKLLLAGVGSLLANTQKYAVEHGLGQNVLFLGFRNDVPKLMNAADGYVMSSLYEGLPLVLLEAQASELPVVATALEPNKEAVLEGESGYLCSTRDPCALAETMLKVMRKSRTERELLGNNGAAHIRANYDMEKVVNHWEVVYSRYATPGGRAPQAAVGDIHYSCHQV